MFSKWQIRILTHLKLAGWVLELYAVGSCGNANGWILSSEENSSVRSRTWNLFRPLKTISRFLGRVRWRIGDFLISFPLTVPQPLPRLLILPMPESDEISRCAWKPFFVVLAACFAFFASIEQRGAKLTDTGNCGFGKLDVCSVNFETIAVAVCGVGRTLKYKK